MAAMTSAENQQLGNKLIFINEFFSEGLGESVFPRVRRISKSTGRLKLGWCTIFIRLRSRGAFLRLCADYCAYGASCLLLGTC